MARKKRPEEHENHERWLVSYADFITLMFAFFVVMFASSQADKEKNQQLSEAINQALEHGQVSTKIQEFISGESKAKTPPPAKPHKMSELNSPLQELTKALHEEIQKGQVQVTMESRGLVISLKQAAFFPTGDSTIAVSGYPTIEKVARTLLKVPNPVRLEGHTDSIPISNVHYRSNWHLSSARSIAMLDLLTMKFRIPAERLAVVGYGDTVPIDGNETETGRARNRRVDITVLNDSSFTAEPQPGAKLTAAAQPQSVTRTP